MRRNYAAGVKGTGRTGWKSVLALWAFPLALWAVCVAWYGFDLGRFSDDWAISLRTPETDAYRWPASPWVRWPYFWRPLHLVSVYGLATIFWHASWVIHAVSALAHLGVAVALFSLLRSIGCMRGAASAGAVMVLAWPLNYEAVLWPAAIGSVVGTGGFLLLALLVVRLARNRRELQRAESLRWIGAIAGTAFLTACWHEQPAACAAGLAALVMAVRPRGMPARMIVRRILLVGSAAALGCGTYIALLMGTAPGGRRGSAESLVSLDGAELRLQSTLSQIREWLFGSRFVEAAVGQAVAGARIAAERPLGAMVLAAVVALAGWWVLRGLRAGDAERGDGAGVAAGRPYAWPWLVIFAVVISAASLVPVVLVRGNYVFARYFYPTGVGVAVIGATLLDSVLVRAGGAFAWRVCRLVFGGLIAVMCLIGMLAMVGWQDDFRERSMLDEQVAQNLREAVPALPSGAVLVPVQTADHARFKGRAFPAGRVPGALAQPWSSWAFVQRSFARSDLSATHWRPGTRPPISADENGVAYPRGLSDAWGRVQPGHTFIPWERVVAFTVSAGAEVRILTPDEARKRLAERREPEE